MIPALQVRNLSLAWQQGSSPLFQGISFSLYPGEIVGIIGNSGCGKSSLCLALAGIIPRQIPGIVQGELYVMGQSLQDMSLAQITAQVGIVFQDPETQLFLPRVLNELAFGSENLCVSPPEIWESINTIAAELGISNLLNTNPNQLSGGQQQLVALAAVLAMQSQVLILDEVTSQLDSAAAQRFQEIAARLRQRGVAILMVEHNLEQLRQANRIIALVDGRVEVAATAEELFSNESLLTRIYGRRSEA